MLSVCTQMDGIFLHKANTGTSCVEGKPNYPMIKVMVKLWDFVLSCHAFLALRWWRSSVDVRWDTHCLMRWCSVLQTRWGTRSSPTASRASSRTPPAPGRRGGRGRKVGVFPFNTETDTNGILHLSDASWEREKGLKLRQQHGWGHIRILHIFILN